MRTGPVGGNHLRRVAAPEPKCPLHAGRVQRRPRTRIPATRGRMRVLYVWAAYGHAALRGHAAGRSWRLNGADTAGLAIAGFNSP